ncbi:hypothetical protein HG530_011837 [Fusarium avenaceum]|nr:hypothetical protein HG530_011837 [Fusarium avenaceum]
MVNLFTQQTLCRLRLVKFSERVSLVTDEITKIFIEIELLMSFDHLLRLSEMHQRFSEHAFETQNPPEDHMLAEHDRLFKQGWMLV